MPERLKAPLALIDHRGIDWSRVYRTASVVHQRLRYEYPGPIEELRQRLVVFPPDRHGGQRLVVRELLVSVEAEMGEETDQFGNRVCHLFVPRVERAIEFEARLLIERTAGPGNGPARAMRGRRFLEPTHLTRPDARLSEIVALLAKAAEPSSLAERICHWVWHSISYAHGVTGVRTTAAEVVALGQGVCQDYAHVMLALCRLLGLPARYVSGHLLGEGGTHAWVEVLAPDPARSGRHSIQAFDPTHGRRSRQDYITVAVGRDYADVAPTSGTYIAPYGGQLQSHKQAGLTGLKLRPIEAA